MGVMARRLGTNYVITSDRVAGEASTKQPPKRSAGDSYAADRLAGGQSSRQTLDGKANLKTSLERRHFAARFR